MTDKTITMYDSVTIADLPRKAKYILAYVDGTYMNVGQAVASFPDAVIVHCTTRAEGTLTADVIDCETGDATPAEAAHWASRKILAHLGTPTIYANSSTLPAVRDALRQYSISPEVELFEAHYDGRPVITPGTVAKQYANSLTSGGHYDISIVKVNAAMLRQNIVPKPAHKLGPVTRWLIARTTKRLHGAPYRLVARDRVAVKRLGVECGKRDGT